MRKRTTKPAPAFSLVELVVVVMIIGMLASMAIPRMSRGAVGANDASVAGNLNIIRTVILYYAVEHRNQFPGPDSPGTIAKLTQYSDTGGTTSPIATATAIHGPYLLKIPPCPMGYNPGSDGIMIDGTNSPPKSNPINPAGWVYNPNTGEFYPNASDEDLARILSGAATTATVIVTGD